MQWKGLIKSIKKSAASPALKSWIRKQRHDWKSCPFTGVISELPETSDEAMNAITVVTVVCGTGILFLLAIFAGFYREAKRDRRLRSRIQHTVTSMGSVRRRSQE